MMQASRFFRASAFSGAFLVRFIEPLENSPFPNPWRLQHLPHQVQTKRPNLFKTIVPADCIVSRFRKLGIPRYPSASSLSFDSRETESSQTPPASCCIVGIDD